MLEKKEVYKIVELLANTVSHFFLMLFLKRLFLALLFFKAFSCVHQLKNVPLWENFTKHIKK